jgi:murein DD-endopeptidase MepM/ murein hydrolase activator NlpD
MMKKEFLAILIVSVLIGLLLNYLLIPGPVHYTEEYKESIDSLEIIPVIKREYGIPVDSFEIIRGRVRRHQTLGSILTGFRVPQSVIAKISSSPRELFDPRRVRAGNNYSAFVEKDSLAMLRYFVYEHSPVDYVVFDLRDSLRIEKMEKEVITIIREGSGYISTSLWASILEGGINPAVAISLSEIYAWTIDFFGLQKGDQFKVIYEENYVEDTPFGIGKILAASFIHEGKEFHAIPFLQDEVEHFFDYQGNSLRRTFLKAPLRYSRVSSKFSHSRLHPILKIRRPHHGVDYAAPIGTPVYAIGDGKILETRYDSGAGRMIKIRHNSVYTSGYLHLRNYATGIKPGVFVKQGDVIGYVGSSGLSTGPHLDFRVWRNGQPVDPLSIESPPVEPVRDENMEEFILVRDAWVARLAEIDWVSD